MRTHLKSCQFYLLPFLFCLAGCEHKLNAFFIGTRQDTSSYSYKYDAYISSADGSNLQIVSADGNHFLSAWSPDGKKFLYNFKPGHLSDFHNQALGIMNVNGSGEKKMVDVDENHTTLMPKFSPDGRKISYLQLSRIQSENHTSLWVMNVDGSGLRKVDGEEGSEMLEYDWSSK